MSLYLTKAARSLRKARQDKGLTQKEAAKLLGTTQGCLSEYEAGKSRPSITVAARIEKEFGVALSEWL